MQTFVFGQKWPDQPPGNGNTYWIGLNTAAAPMQRPGVMILDRECASLPELEAVARKLHEEVDRALSEAREKLQPDPAPMGFQTQVGEMRSPRRR